MHPPLEKRGPAKLHFFPLPSVKILARVFSFLFFRSSIELPLRDYQVVLELRRSLGANNSKLCEKLLRKLQKTQDGFVSMVTTSWNARIPKINSQGTTSRSCRFPSLHHRGDARQVRFRHEYGIWCEMQVFI